MLIPLWCVYFTFYFHFKIANRALVNSYQLTYTTLQNLTTFPFDLVPLIPSFPKYNCLLRLDLVGQILDCRQIELPDQKSHFLAPELASQYVNIANSIKGESSHCTQPD